MQYVKYGEKTGWDVRDYFAYLEAIKVLIPQHIFKFAATIDNYTLRAPNSLHDSWVDTWTIAEQSDPERKRTLNIKGRLLGQMHDRFIVLNYGSVRLYEMDMMDREHCDLLMHEMLMLPDDHFSHELLFAGGSRFYFEFKEFSHHIEPIAGRET